MDIFFTQLSENATQLGAYALVSQNPFGANFAANVVQSYEASGGVQQYENFGSYTVGFDETQYTQSEIQDWLTLNAEAIVSEYTANVELEKQNEISLIRLIRTFVGSNYNELSSSDQARLQQWLSNSLAVFTSIVDADNIITEELYLYAGYPEKIDAYYDNEVRSNPPKATRFVGAGTWRFTSWKINGNDVINPTETIVIDAANLDDLFEKLLPILNENDPINGGNWTFENTGDYARHWKLSGGDYADYGEIRLYEGATGSTYSKLTPLVEFI